LEPFCSPSKDSTNKTIVILVKNESQVWTDSKVFKRLDSPSYQESLHTVTQDSLSGPCKKDE